MGQQRFYHKANVDPETNEGKDQRSGLIILQKTKDLMKYLYTTWTKYPRSEKLGFVTDYKKCLFGFLEYIIAAQKKYFKKTTLQDADIQLEELRLFNDLSYDLRCAISGNINVAIKLVSTGTKTGKGFTGSATPTAENLGAYSKERNFVNEDL